MSFTLCSSAAAIRKAGANANSVAIASDAILNSWSEEIESTICAVARSDVVTNFGSLTTNGKEVLQSISASFVAQQIISYDMSGFTSRLEAQTMLDVLDNSVTKNLSIIKEDRNKTYLGIT